MDTAITIGFFLEEQTARDCKRAMLDTAFLEGKRIVLACCPAWHVDGSSKVGWYLHGMGADLDDRHSRYLLGFSAGFDAGR